VSKALRFALPLFRHTAVLPLIVLRRADPLPDTAVVRIAGRFHSRGVSGGLRRARLLPVNDFAPAILLAQRLPLHAAVFAFAILATADVAIRAPPRRVA